MQEIFERMEYRLGAPLEAGQAGGAVEYRTGHGSATFFVKATVRPQEDAGAVCAFALREAEDGSWAVQLEGDAGERETTMPKEEADALFARVGLDLAGLKEKSAAAAAAFERAETPAPAAEEPAAEAAAQEEAGTDLPPLPGDDMAPPPAEDAPPW